MQGRRLRDAEKFEPAAGRCPRCGEEFAPGCYWERLPPPEDRQPAWRCRHRRTDGSWCLVHSGPAIAPATGEGEGGR
jgi:hypothetical protein